MKRKRKNARVGDALTKSRKPLALAMAAFWVVAMVNDLSVPVGTLKLISLMVLAEVRRVMLSDRIVDVLYIYLGDGVGGIEC